MQFSTFAFPLVSIPRGLPRGSLFGNNLIFKVSNQNVDYEGQYSQNYELKDLGDSLYIPDESWGKNPIIKIPPSDSISIKSVSYGQCILCPASTPSYDYQIALYFIVNENEYSKLRVVGTFALGIWRNSRGRENSSCAINGYKINGKYQIKSIDRNEIQLNYMPIK